MYIQNTYAHTKPSMISKRYIFRCLRTYTGYASVNISDGKDNVNENG